MPVTSHDPNAPRPGPITPQRAAGAVLLVLVVLSLRLLWPPVSQPAVAPTPTPGREPAPLLIEAQLPTSIPRPSAAPAATPAAAPSAAPSPTDPAACPTPAPRPEGLVVYLARASDCPGLLRVSAGGGSAWVARPPELDDAIYTNLPAQPAIP